MQKGRHQHSTIAREAKRQQPDTQENADALTSTVVCVELGPYCRKGCGVSNEVDNVVCPQGAGVGSHAGLRNLRDDWRSDYLVDLFDRELVASDPSVFEDLPILRARCSHTSLVISKGLPTRLVKGGGMLKGAEDGFPRSPKDPVVNASGFADKGFNLVEEVELHGH